jgi:hypothetical protein
MMKQPLAPVGRWLWLAIFALLFRTAILGAFWVPNPVVLWPFNVIGDHSLPELTDSLFTFHIVPSPQLNYASSAGFYALFHWQLMEIGARLCVLIMAWAIFLATMRRIRRRLQGVNPRNGVP